MVNHQNFAALIRLYYLDPGAPWKWDRWKELTDVRHGLFPDDDDDLPSGWSRDDARNIHSFFESYRALPTEEAKHAFVQAPKKGRGDHPGRLPFRKWVVKNWPRWKIWLLICQAFEAKGITYLQSMVDNESAELPKTMAIAEAFDHIAHALFGDDALTKTGKVKVELRDPVKILAIRAATNLRSRSRGVISRIVEIGARIEQSLDGMC